MKSILDTISAHWFTFGGSGTPYAAVSWDCQTQDERIVLLIIEIETDPGEPLYNWRDVTMQREQERDDDCQ
jgi:hypothetical protein